jgi:hypothetical protein
MKVDQKRVWKKLLVAGATMALVAGTVSTLPSAYAAGKISSDDENQWISIGMGIRGGLAMVEDGSANKGSYSNTFGIANARIYVNGGITKVIKFEFNTECFDCNGQGNPFGQTSATGAQTNIGVLDAIAKFEFNQYVNIWAGRLLVPAERGELNGPFYSATFEQYKTPFQASDFAGKFGTGGAGIYGRDNGVNFWGQVDPGYGHLQYVFGVFTGLQSAGGTGTAGCTNVLGCGPNQQASLLYAGRLTYNFLNAEKNPGYYTSGTYYGKAGDILALGVAVQHQKNGAGTVTTQADLTTFVTDLLFEKPLGNGGENGVITVNAEFKQFFANYNAAVAFGGAGATANGCFCMFDGNSYYGTAMYLFPNNIGMGRFQPYGRFTSVQPNNSETRQETELGTNYIISGHNARLAAYWQYGNLASLGTNYAPNATGHFGNAFKLAFQIQY